MCILWGWKDRYTLHVNGSKQCGPGGLRLCKEMGLDRVKRDYLEISFSYIDCTFDSSFRRRRIWNTCTLSHLCLHMGKSYCISCHRWGWGQHTRSSLPLPGRLGGSCRRGSVWRGRGLECRADIPRGGRSLHTGGGHTPATCRGRGALREGMGMKWTKKNLMMQNRGVRASVRKILKWLKRCAFQCIKSLKMWFCDEQNSLKSDQNLFFFCSDPWYRSKFSSWCNMGQERMLNWLLCILLMIRKIIHVP